MEVFFQQSEVLSGIVESDVHLFVADVIRGFQVGFVKPTLSFTHMFGFGLSWLLGWVNLGHGMVVSLRGAR